MYKKQNEEINIPGKQNIIKPKKKKFYFHWIG